MVEVKIEKMKWLPCSCKEFTINGKSASPSDFGTSESGGDPGQGNCYSKFVHGYPTEEVLQKYGITLNEFREICEKLEDELYIGSCGLCW